MNIDRASLQNLLGTFREWCREHVEVADLEELEQVAEDVLGELGHAMMQECLPPLAAAHGRPAGGVVCLCGHKARYVANRQRGVGTLYGVVEVERAYYHCRHCGRGYVPWDAGQGLSGLLWTPRVKSLVAQAVGYLTYSEAVEMLELLSGFRIEESCAERIVAELSGRLRAEEASQIKGCLEGTVIPLLPHPPHRLYVATDGVSAHIGGSWHEVKVGLVYRGVPGKTGIDECVGQHYVAAQETAEAFGRRLYAAAVQAGVQAAHEVIFIGDGAEWIWNMAELHYPGATQILDYYHATEHIHSLARIMYGEQSPQGERWAKDHCRELKRSGPTSLLRAMKRMKPNTSEQAEAVQREIGYFTRNKHRMEYGQFRARGLMIGSGPVEAGCKTVVGTRLKRAGMRWSPAGADAVLAVRTAMLSGDRQRVQNAAKAA